MAWFASVDHGLPWIVGAGLAVFTAVVIGVGFEWLVVRHMLRAERISVTVATVGLLSLLVSVELQVFSPSPREWPAPVGGLGIQVFGIYVSPTQMIALLLTGALAAGLAVLLKRTDFGLGVQAAAEDPDAARLVGVPLAKVSAFVWGSGAALSAVAALLITPALGGRFTPNDLRVPFVYALAAAVIGGLHSLPGAFVGGFVMGLFKAATARWIDIDSLPLVDLNATVALLLLVLLVSPDGLAGLARRWRDRTSVLPPVAPTEAS